MNSRLGVAVVAIVTLSMSAQSQALGDKKKPAIGVDLETVIRAADKAVKESESVSVGSFPDLKSIQISVNGTIAKEEGGKITFLVFSLGGGRSRERSVTLTFDLKRPPAPAAKTQSADREKWEQAVGEAIARAKEGFAAANRATDRLKTDKVDIEIAFTVKKNGAIGVDTADLIPVGFELNGKVEKSQIHTLTLTFGGGD